MGEAGAEGVATHGDYGLLNRIGYRLLRLFVGVTVRPYFRIRLEGTQHLPPGPCIVAPNHASYLDPIVLQTALPRRLVFLMTLTWYDVPLLRPFFRFMHCIPIDEEARNRKALLAALQALERGASVGIFPEGEVTTTGALGRFTPGVAALALRANVPVVPAGITGTFQALPKGRRFPRPVRVTVRLGPPLAPGGDEAGRAKRDALRQVTAELQQAVRALVS
ncbi:MAG: 1-acyl-sn-glycerol-3-phosphate acyltransferase [Planctomycetes bacterium]|nr:1-acyl-sn-glycerol-3-phosphate acyltransferase [Planctomycetota bacterium]